AEDGIRDFHVTGVQTCALPISGDLDVLGGHALVAVAVAVAIPGVAVAVAGVAVAVAIPVAIPVAGFGADLVGVVRVRPAVTAAEIGRASCRERGTTWGGAGAGG